jgi:hypothetical protein
MFIASMFAGAAIGVSLALVITDLLLQAIGLER